MNIVPGLDNPRKHGTLKKVLVRGKEEYIRISTIIDQVVTNVKACLQEIIGFNVPGKNVFLLPDITFSVISDCVSLVCCI